MMPTTTVEKMMNDALDDPLFALEYFKRNKGTVHPVPTLKKLFNHAGRPVPKDLQDAMQPTFELPRKDIAALAYRTARKNGGNIPSAASWWLKIRLG